MIKKFYNHYQRVNRKYGVPMYRYNDYLYLFGNEMNEMKKAVPELHIENECGIEYIRLYHELSSKIKYLFSDRINVIFSEEAFYGFY